MPELRTPVITILHLTGQTPDVPLPLSTKRICYIVVHPRDISFILRRTADVSRRGNILTFIWTQDIQYIKSLKKLYYRLLTDRIILK